MQQVKERIYPDAAEVDVTPAGIGQWCPVSWSALWAGAIAGLAGYVLLTLLGLALGVITVDVSIDGIRPDNTSDHTFAWTTGTMMVAAAAGSFFAARLCGLSRKMDGIMHALVVWGATIVLFIVISSSAPSALFGGIFSAFVQPLPLANGGGPGTGYLVNQLRFRVPELPGSNIFVRQNLDYLNSFLLTRDRMGAIRFMTQVMGVDGTHATETVDKLLYLYAQSHANTTSYGMRVETRLPFSRARSHLWKFLLPVILSAIASMAGGVAGVRYMPRQAEGCRRD